MEAMTRKRKLFTSIAVVTMVAALGAFATYAAFSATTSNTGNQIQSGTVDLNDTDGGTGKLSYLIGDQLPNASSQKCIRINYTGTLAATVKLYRSAVNAAANGRYTLQVERGTDTSAPDSTMSCADFNPTADVFASADLDTLGDTYAGGVDVKGSAFATGNFVDLRFTTTVKDGVVNGNKTNNDTGSFDYTFEARNN